MGTQDAKRDELRTVLRTKLKERVVREISSAELDYLLEQKFSNADLLEGISEADLPTPPFLGAIRRHILRGFGIGAETSRGRPVFAPGSGSRLVNAPRFVKQSETVSLLTDSDGCNLYIRGLPQFLVDEGGTLISNLTRWLDILGDGLGNTGNSLLPALFINGLVKTGKSYGLNEVLPGVARSHPRFGVGGDREMVICRLNFEEIAGGQTYELALRRFLRALLVWSAGDSGDAVCLDRLAILDVGSLQSEIMEFMRNLPQTTLFLGDEMQAWFLRPEEDARMARGLLKALVINTPDTAVFAFTGSSMCSVWANVAATAPNGISMLLHNTRCNLPAAISTAASDESWQFLQQACPAVPADLAAYISRSLPAMQVYLAQEYQAQLERPTSEAELLSFVQKFEVSKLQLEVAKDFVPTLESLSPEQRLILLHLVSDDGALLGRLDDPIALLMDPYLKTEVDAAAGTTTVRLDVPWHAGLIKSLISEDGNIKALELASPATWTPLAYTSACEAMAGFGEEVNLALRRKPSLSEIERPFKGMAANQACAKSAWWQDAWAQAILTHPKCSAAARTFAAKAQQKQPTTALLLAQLHVCLRHIQAHKGFSTDTKHIVDTYPFAKADSVSQYLKGIAESSPILRTMSRASAAPAVSPSSPPGTPPTASSASANAPTITGTSSSSAPSNPASSASASSSGSPGMSVPKSNSHGPGVSSAGLNCHTSDSVFRLRSCSLSFGVSQPRQPLSALMLRTQARRIVERACRPPLCRPTLRLSAPICTLNNRF